MERSYIKQVDLPIKITRPRKCFGCGLSITKGQKHCGLFLRLTTKALHNKFYFHENCLSNIFKEYEKKKIT